MPNIMVEIQALMNMSMMYTMRVTNTATTIANIMEDNLDRTKMSMKYIMRVTNTATIIANIMEDSKALMEMSINLTFDRYITFTSEELIGI